MFAIIPFDFILSSQNNMNKLARITKLGKLYKVVKMTRLIRTLKIIKEKNKLVTYLSELLKIGIGVERLIFVLAIFIILCHIAGCLW